jgi:hypothetical protein
MLIEHFIRDSDNQIKMTLTEDGTAISGSWDALDIWIGDDVNLHRENDGDGISLSSEGLLIITPADLQVAEKEQIAALLKRTNYRVQIIVTSINNDDGAVFGGDGSDRIVFLISDKPE